MFVTHGWRDTIGQRYQIEIKTTKWRNIKWDYDYRRIKIVIPSLLDINLSNFKFVQLFIDFIIMLTYFSVSSIGRSSYLCADMDAWTCYIRPSIHTLHSVCALSRLYAWKYKSEMLEYLHLIFTTTCMWVAWFMYSLEYAPVSVEKKTS